MRFAFVCAFVSLNALAQPSPNALVECQAETPAATAAYLAQLAPQAHQDLQNAEAAARAMMKNRDRSASRPVALPAFNRSAKAWQSYRDAHCSWLEKIEANATACRIDLDRQRADELSRFYI
jgi:uncharacterized protein YecT (DUF1311 family)